MSPVYHSFILICTFLSETTSYWLSQNTLTWDSASAYCQERCQSHLASVHDLDQFHEADNLINDSIAKYNQVPEVWIGLRDMYTDSDSEDWKWSDGTSFDYGTDTSGGVFPWEDRYGLSEPSPNFHDCTIFVESRWRDRECSETYRFLCNDCEGVLDKYIFYHTQTYYSSALQTCTTDLNTSLASIHNDDDNHAMTSLVHMNQDAWIGLHRHNKGWIWLDETYFDYGSNVSGGVYPWGKKDGVRQPDNTKEDCTAVFDQQLLWKDDLCNENAHTFVCNKPSELCAGDHWEALNHMYKNNITFHHCTASIAGDAQVFMTHARWDKDNWPLQIEYTFAVHEVWDDENQVGIVVSQNDNICASRFIGLSISNNNAFVQGGTQPIPFILNRFYRLLVQISSVDSVDDTLQFNISLDDTLIGSFSVPKAFYRRYIIGIQNKNSNVTAKSLFVSGTPQYSFTQSLHFDCTSEPTSYPTIQPSLSTVAPSGTPTTQRPSTQPSVDPSARPSGTPTTPRPTLNANRPTTSTAPTFGPSQLPVVSIHSTLYQSTAENDGDGKANKDVETLFHVYLGIGFGTGLCCLVFGCCVWYVFFAKRRRANETVDVLHTHSKDNVEGQKNIVGVGTHTAGDSHVVTLRSGSKSAPKQSVLELSPVSSNNVQNVNVPDSPPLPVEEVEEESTVDSDDLFGSENSTDVNRKVTLQ
eukprot:679531_1